MKFRKKPVVVEAVQWTGDNLNTCYDFCKPLMNETYRGGSWLSIPSLEGKMRCEKMDWIIKGVKGEFYPCKPDIFELTYEKI